MTTVFPAWDLPAVPVAGTAATFPVRHVYCVGRNYAEHAKEMGGDASKEPPFFFTKAADVDRAGRAAGRRLDRLPARDVEPAPRDRARRRHRRARRASSTPDRALDLVFGYAVGLDMTRRDLQNDMREKKRPWDIGKSFAQAAPIAVIHPAGAVGHLARGGIWLDVNGARRQQGDLADMIWDVAHTLAFLSQFYELMPGDLVFTGTPSGVGAVVAGRSARRRHRRPVAAVGRRSRRRAER